MAITGGTNTITFTGLTLTAATSITPREVTLEPLEDSDLSTTGYKTYVPADLAEPGGVDLEFFYDDQTADDVLTQLTSTKAGSVLITFASGSSGTIAGTGFVDRFDPGESAQNQLIRASLGIQFDGKTGPTFADV